MLDLTDCSAGKWPSVHASIEFSGVLTPEDSARKDSFCRELCRLFDRLQEGFDRLEAAEKARCGLDGVAAEVFLQVDLKKRKIVLDKLFKYCEMDFHLFTELLGDTAAPFSRLLSGSSLLAGIRAGPGDPAISRGARGGVRLPEGGHRGAAAHGRRSAGDELRGHPGGYTEALRGAGRRGEEEAGTGAGPRALHVLAGDGRRRGGLVDAGENCFVEISYLTSLRFTSQNRTTVLFRDEKG